MIETILGAFKSLAGIIIPSIRKKYLDQPKIYIVFKFDNSSKTPKGVSHKTDAAKAVFPTEVIYYNDLNWEYDIIFRNNSEFPAYNFKLISPKIDTEFSLYPKIDSLKPILPNSEVSYKAKFYQSYEGKGSDAITLLDDLPEKIKSEEFVLEYTNVKGTKFYTTYNKTLEKDSHHEFTRKRKIK